MKVLVFSDSHGDAARMVQVTERETPDMLFHLGDGWRDAKVLHARFPRIPLYQVPGNCDFRREEPPERLLTVEGKRILLCHGHNYRVKDSLLTAGLRAEELQLDAFLFGHTHKPLVDLRGETWFMNPGSIGDFHASYGVITLGDGKLDCRTAVY